MVVLYLLLGCYIDLQSIVYIWWVLWSLFEDVFRAPYRWWICCNIFFDVFYAWIPDFDISSIFIWPRCALILQSSFRLPFSQLICFFIKPVFVGLCIGVLSFSLLLQRQFPPDNSLTSSRCFIYCRCLQDCLTLSACYLIFLHIFVTWSLLQVILYYILLIFLSLSRTFLPRTSLWPAPILTEVNTLTSIMYPGHILLLRSPSNA